MYLSTWKSLLCIIVLFCLCEIVPALGKPTSEDGNPLVGVFQSAAVATDGEPCATVGKEILEEGGTAVDAAVAALFCNGIYSCHSMGLGGGFLMTIYNHSAGTAEVLNARETAPGLTTEDMFHGNGSLSTKSPLAVGVPGQVAGYWEARRRYGNKDITWERILRPTIDMCRQGIPVSWSLDHILSTRHFTDPEMIRVFINPATGETWKQGETYTRPVLADTLELLAIAGDAGDELFYRGYLAQQLVEDLQSLGGILSTEDMNNYKAKWEEPIVVPLPETQLTLYSVPPPGSGAVLAAIINIMENFEILEDDPVFYHRLVEAFKWAYGGRSNLGDPIDEEITGIVEKVVANLTSFSWAYEKFNMINDSATVNDPLFYGADFYEPNDHGTSHMSVISPTGDAVAVTSTINLYFGSEIMSPKTGIIFNDEMDDFSYPDIINEFGLPPSPNNFAKPGKRPLSSMSPAIFVDSEGDVRLAIGAAGGTRITSSTALASLLNLRMGWDIATSVDAPRLHHQLMPMYVQYQSEFRGEVIEELEKKGHITKDKGSAGSVVGAIARLEDGRLMAKADYRKAGGVDGF